ncbi:hypothetical protein SMICM304S_01495 [Streptomyces microflavus]
MNFTNSAGAFVTSFQKPDSDSIFGCYKHLDAPNDLVRGPISRTLCAGFNRSTLLTGANQPDNNAANFCRDAVTNHYSRLIHAQMVDGKAYGFAFDDVGAHGALRPRRQPAGSVHHARPVQLTVCSSPAAGAHGRDPVRTGRRLLRHSPPFCPPLPPFPGTDRCERAVDRSRSAGVRRERDDQGVTKSCHVWKPSVVGEFASGRERTRHAQTSTAPTRRTLLRASAATAAGGVLVAGASPVGAVTRTRAVPSTRPGTPAAALAALSTGNRRSYLHQQHPHESSSVRHSLVSGQTPFALILGCIDSRAARSWSSTRGWATS